jgi:hypothetical protein
LVSIGSNLFRKIAVNNLNLSVVALTQYNRAYDADKKAGKGKRVPHPGSERLLIFSYFPLPLSATLCGLLGALSLSRRVAFCVPVAVGRNVTLITQLAPAWRVAGAVPQVVLLIVN